MNELFLEDDELKLDFFGDKKKSENRSEPISEENDLTNTFPTDDKKRDKKLYNNFITSDIKDINADDTRNIHFLMEKFKEDNNGIGSNDICVLFSFW